MKDKLVDKIEELEAFKEKQHNIEAEASSARTAYTFMKGKLTTKDDEISSLEKQILT